MHCSKSGRASTSSACNELKPNPGCAAAQRPWAAECNRFAVKNCGQADSRGKTPYFGNEPRADASASCPEHGPPSLPHSPSKPIRLSSGERIPAIANSEFPNSHIPEFPWSLSRESAFLYLQPAVERAGNVRNRHNIWGIPGVRAGFEALKSVIHHGLSADEVRRGAGLTSPEP